MDDITKAENDLIRCAMRALGKRKSEAKTRACRANARKPRKALKRKAIGVKPSESTLDKDASSVV